jgi:DNA ligase-1
MRLADLVETSRAVAATSSRLEKVERLAAFIQRLPPGLTRLGVAYLIGEPPQGRLGVGFSTLGAWRDVGPAGAATLELAEVDRIFADLKREAGAGSAERRSGLVGGLLARATLDEQKFLVGLLAGEIRQGALEGVLADAVARAFQVKGAEVRRACMLAGGLPPVAAALAEAGSRAGSAAAGLTRFELRIFHPVQPMLADSAPDVGAALDRLGEAAFEYKLDGARVQVHKDGERVEVYSRQGRAVTAAVPELVERVSALPAQRLVMDGEAISFSAQGRPLPFQITMRRFGRKLDVAHLRHQQPIAGYFFDALRIDDDTLMDRPLAQRWAALAAALPPEALVPRLVTGDPREADAFLSRALADGHEGVMAKGLAAVYSAGRRGKEWLKLKTAHTLDLVVLAAEWGSGRRQGWLSNLHLGARDPRQGGFVMLGKTFKGMTDEVLRWQTEALLAREIARDGIVVHVKPELVVEIAFNDVQQSRQYPGGVALRFARLKHYRPDKRPDQADTIDKVRSLLPGG